MTGASSGLGRELSIALSKLGSKLFITGKNKTELRKTYKMLDGKNHSYFAFDLNKIDKIENLLSKIFSSELKYDGFIHCAGVHTLLPLKFVEIDNMVEAFNVNVFAPTLISKEFSKRKNYNTNSSIIIISSVMSYLGASSLSVYSSSKAAQIGIMKSLSVELSSKKIRVNSISASLITSKILDKVKSKLLKNNWDELEKKHLLGFGNYKDLIPMIVYLLSNESKWTTGSNIIIDGGFSSW